MLTVATAIFGMGFSLFDPTGVWPACRFVCFTDREDLKSDRWEIVRQTHPSTPRRANRCVKTTLHRYVAGPTLYVDADYQVIADPHEIVGRSLEQSCWAATLHPQRDCLFEEAAFCSRRKRLESKRPLAFQLRRYRQSGMPEHFGLWAGGILARRGDADSERFGEAWWDQIKRGSERDQVSLPYVAWRLGLMPGVIPGVYTKLPGLQRRRRPKC